MRPHPLLIHFQHEFSANMASLAQLLRSERFFEVHFGNFGRSNNACLDQSSDFSELGAIRLDEHEGR